jgi:hypothetical protein
LARLKRSGTRCDLSGLSPEPEQVINAPVGRMGATFEPVQELNNQPCRHALLPANHKVSVGWQIVFTFIIVLNFWAFYRIRKLRK